MKPARRELVPDHKRFSWEALETGADPRYWELGWELVRRQRERIHDDVPPDLRNDPRGTDAVAIADLAVGRERDMTTYLRFHDERFVRGRDIVGIASDPGQSVIPSGASLRLIAQVPDHYYEGLGCNFWLTDDERPYASAFEGRWGMEATLADALIVPARTPLASDSAAQRRLLDDLRAITIAFRVERGLPPEAATEDPGAARIAERLDPSSGSGHGRG